MAGKDYLSEAKEEAAGVIRQIQEETKHYAESEIAYFKSGLNKETQAYYQSELNDLKRKTQSAIASAKLATKRELLAKRSAKTKQLFEELTQKLLDFCASPDYPAYCKKKLLEIGDEDPQAVFYVKKRDLDLFKELLQQNNWKQTVKAAAIEIGGFIYHSDKAGLEIDATLDGALNKERQWFVEHCAFLLEEAL
ncbi:MAG: hypothetical protein LBR25_05230 [Erysipelotrichaceae bacterium]|nr:hypothetical protein [Erysipelotrichaceae bacterium]